MITLSMSKIRAAVVVAAFAVASGPLALYAQTPTTLGVVKIPFAFEVGSAHFAPGTYTLTRQSENLLMIRGASGAALALDRHDADLSRATQGKVVFQRYGDQRFLREVWIEGNTDHLSFTESKAERQAERSLRTFNVGSIPAPSVEIALLENPR